MIRIDEKTMMEERLPIVEQCVGCDKVEGDFCKSYINPAMWWGKDKGSSQFSQSQKWCPLCSTLIPIKVEMKRDKKYKSQKTWTIEWMPKEVAKERGFDTRFVKAPKRKG